MFVMTSGARHSHSHTHGEPLGSIQGKEPSHGIASEEPQESFKKDQGLKEFPTTTSHCASKNLHASSRLLSVSLVPRSTDDVVSHNTNNRSSDKKEDVEDDLDETCQIEIPLGDERSNNLFMDAERYSESTSKAHQKRMMIQCFMLEAAIIFHSIFIGMAISVATGPPFIVLLIAIGFHQVFEGLALGSRIAAIQFSPRSLRPWFMVLAYGITTPIGQAIGLVLHNLYDPQSAAGLLMVGFMNAISSGLLIYAGLVQLLAEDLLSEKSFETLNGRRRIEAFGSVLIGALLMALVGAWA
ncbi:hypothetical protein K3495_g10015 [Podosphaera aphanis]|nr:hypothetical protein K3495_g10015 [Podosphaera aphanis]